MSEEKNDEDLEEIETPEETEEQIEDDKETLEADEQTQEIDEEELEIPEVPLEAETLEDEEAETISDEEEFESVTEEAEDEDKTKVEEEFKELVEEELEIPSIPTETDDEIEESEAEEDLEELELKEEQLEETEKIKKPKKKKKRSLSLLIGVIVGLVIAVTTEVLFTIPAWRNDTSSPDLYYIELVIVLIALIIPGLVTRSIQKGLIGALIIFIVTFGLPFLFMLFDVLILNPLTPLFSSTDFALSALEVFKDLFNIQFDFESLQKWIWIIDLVLMFILMVIVVTIGAALIKNITLPKKKVGNWIAIPFLSIGLIIFMIFTPIVYSSTYGVIQASTSFLAGSTQLTNAYGLFESNTSDLSTLDAEVKPLLDNAGYWFNISQRNYQGLRNIGVITFAVLVSGQYGPLIEAGDQLALATLSFTQVLYPLFNGIYTLTNSFNNATESMAKFGQSEQTQILFIDQMNSGIQAQAENDNITDLKNSLLEAIRGMDSAQDSLDTVLLALQEADVSGSFDEVEEALDALDYDKLPAKLADSIQQIHLKLDEFKNQLSGFETLIEYTKEALNPTKDLLWIAYYALAGNDYLKKYNFNDAYDAFNNATDIISEIDDIPEFTPGVGLTDIFAVDLTDDYSIMLEDLLALMDPLLNEEKYFAATYIEIAKMLQIFEATGNDITAVNYLSYNPIPLILANATQTASYGDLADTQLQNFRAHIAAEDYGDAFTGIAGDFDRILTDDFKPKEFGDYTNALSQALDHYWTGCKEFKDDNMVFALANLTEANDIIQADIITVFDRDETPDYYESYLDAWATAMNDITTAMDDLTRPEAILAIQSLLDDLQLAIVEKV